MPRRAAVDLSALCTVLSFLYTSESLERHSLTASPRLSSLLVLLVSGCICFAGSALAALVPAANIGLTSAPGEDLHRSTVPVSEYDGDFFQGSKAHLPARPRKSSLPTLIVAIVLRLEVFHRVNYQQQCSTPGIESFLCVVLIGHQIFVTRRKWGFPPSKDADDPWRSIFDDIHDWFSGPRVVMFNSVLSALAFSLGSFLSLAHSTRSGYLCLHLIDSRLLTVALQLLGLGLDAAVLVLTWRILAWARTTAERTRLLGTVQLLSALSISFLYLGTALDGGFHRVNVSLGSLNGFDIAADGLAFAALLTSLSFWICETSVVTPLSTLTFLVGIRASCGRVFQMGDWLHLARFGALSPLYMIVLGTIPFTYLYDIRSILFVQRIVFALLLLALLLGATIFLSLKQPESFGRHPVSDFVYSAYHEHDRWLSIANTSESLPTAVRIYQERHDGRSPPPNFGEWFEYARGSAVMDDFPQIDRDIAPFWSIPPSTLRQRADEMAAMGGDVGLIFIRGGQVVTSTTSAGNEQSNRDLEELAAMIAKFSKYLPDMLLPINLGPAPRVLPTWGDASPMGEGAATSVIAELLSKRSLREYSYEYIHNHTQATELFPVRRSSQDAARDSISPARAPPTWASDFRQMQVEACSPLSRTRTRPHWNFMEFCSACVEAHSLGQLVTKWQQSLDVCSQPDIRLLHGLSLTDPQRPPIRRLSPLFGASKTDEFRDIIIPMPRPSRLERPDPAWHFARRYDGLCWRGSVGEQGITNQALRGSHKFRLLHLVDSPYPQDEVTMILPEPGDRGAFGYQRIKASQANELVRLTVSLDRSEKCQGSKCALVQKAYGEGEEEGFEPLEYRYVLLLDEDNGPPREMMRTLRSSSVPFISTIFRTWFTDRLMPWLHFVPIDPRFHGLHTTLAYFTGTEDRAQVKVPPVSPSVSVDGRQMSMVGNSQDAEWIAQQGQKWAEKALRDKDMEIYLFRVLLEWGRVIDDHRDEIGLRKDGKGGFQNVGWTKRGATQGAGAEGRNDQEV